MADWIFLDHHTLSKPSLDLTNQLAKDTTQFWLFGPKHKALSAVFELIGVKEKHMACTASHGEIYREVYLDHYLNFIRETGRTHILAHELDDSELIRSLQSLQQLEIQTKLLPVTPQGHLTAATLEEHLRARSGLLTLTWAHPKTGVIQPIFELIEVCKRHDVKVHLDISAAIGKLHFQIDQFDVDYVTFCGGLMQMPLSIGVLLSSKRLSHLTQPSYALCSNLLQAFDRAFNAIEVMAMEGAFLRDFLENGLEKMGATLPFKETQRLPNVAAVQFPKLHAQQLTHALRQEGIFATTADPFTLSFALCETTSREEIERVLAIFPKILEKLTKEEKPFVKGDAQAKNMRVVEEAFGEEKQGRKITFSWLVDEEDGVIADAKVFPFGPPAFHEAASIFCREVLRKNYLQAKRITAHLIEGQMAFPAVDSDLNLILDCIDGLAEKCMDIPIEDIYVAPPEMNNGERKEYPGWETLSNEQKKSVIHEVMQRDIQPYVELDAGGVEVMRVEDNRVTIAYSGNCTSCFSATGATLDAIGNILRHQIYPDLMVIPDLTLLQQ